MIEIRVLGKEVVVVTAEFFDSSDTREYMTPTEARMLAQELVTAANKIEGEQDASRKEI